MQRAFWSLRIALSRVSCRLDDRSVAVVATQLCLWPCLGHSIEKKMPNVQSRHPSSVQKKRHLFDHSGRAGFSCVVGLRSPRKTDEDSSGQRGGISDHQGPLSSVVVDLDRVAHPAQLCASLPHSGRRRSSRRGRHYSATVVRAAHCPSCGKNIGRKLDCPHAQPTTVAGRGPHVH